MGVTSHQIFDEMTQPEITGQLILYFFQIVVRKLPLMNNLCPLIYHHEWNAMSWNHGQKPDK